MYSKGNYAAMLNNNKSSFKKFCVVMAGVDWWLFAPYAILKPLSSSHPIVTEQNDYSNCRFLFSISKAIQTCKSQLNLDTINHMSSSICFGT